MTDHDREQAHIMSASTAFANVQARNTEIKSSHTLLMEAYEPSLNRVKKIDAQAPRRPMHTRKDR
jgi:3-deoxy-D-arabino-heptulosonate 7-phosphate (DAHP) synthase class II